MKAGVWRRKIGDSAFQAILTAYQRRHSWRGEAEAAAMEDVVASMLDAVVTAGFRPPETAPVVDPRGTKVLWPSPGGFRPVLTAAGLAEHYASKGHGYLIFRLTPLLRGVGQFLLPRLQELCVAYESECAAAGIDPLPINNRLFVGGTADAPLEGLASGVPAPIPMPIDRFSTR